MAYTQAQLVAAYTNANAGTAPSAAQTIALTALANQNASGTLTDSQALAQTIALAANSTTAVSVDTYAFFTGVAPSVAGLQALNAAYVGTGAQANLNGENRFIAQSVSLALGNTAAKTAFTTSYGSLSVADATAAAYNVIVGNAAAAAANINVSAAVAYLSSASSIAYYTNFVKANVPGLATGSAADIDLAVKAAIVGEIFWNATQANSGLGVGSYASATNNLLKDLSDDGALTANNAAGINLFGAYGTSGGSTGGTAGSTIALTTGIDTLTGTANDDTFNGVIATNAAATADIRTTYSALDSVNGGAGVDTLNITYFDNTAAGAVALGNTTLPAATVTGVENINVRSLSITAADVTTIAAGGFSGATQFISDRSSNAVSVTGLTSGQAIGLNGVSGAAAIALTGTYGATATSSVINLSGGVIDNAGNATNTITVTGAGLTTSTINSTGSANGVGAVAVGPGGTISTLNLNAGVGLTLGGFTGLGVATSGATATINITGAGNVTVGGITAAGGNIGTLNINTSTGTANIGTIANAGFAANATINVSGPSTTTASNTATVTLGTLGANVKTVNGSGLTAGGINATIGANTGTVFTGGAGTDVITIGAGQGAGLTGSINGGAGTDIIAFTTGADIAANLTSLVTNFETLRVSNGGAVGTTQTYDPTLINGITSYQVGASSGAVVLNNLVANASVTVIGSVAGTAGLDLNLKDASGTADTINLRFDNLTTSGTNVNGVTVTDLNLGGSANAGTVETLAITSAGRVSGTGTYNGATIGASGAGPNYADPTKITIAGAAGFTLTTGIAQHNLVIDASANTGGVNITNTAAVTGTVAITGTAVNDTINSANVATIYGGAGGDAITLGAGAQTIAYKAAGDSVLDLTGVTGSSGTGGTVNIGKMDTVTGFTVGTDKIEVTTFAFNATQLGAIVDKGSVTTDAGLNAALASSTLYSDGVFTRGFAEIHYGADTYLAIDANKDGLFNASTDLVVKFVGGTITILATDLVG